MSLALIERGLAIPARRNDRQLWRMYFLYERAIVRSIQQRPADAASDLRAALSYAREWRDAIAPSDSLRSGAEYWLKGVYDAYIDAANKSNLVVEAFLAVEEERSASLLQMLEKESAGALTSILRIWRICRLLNRPDCVPRDF